MIPHLPEKEPDRRKVFDVFVGGKRLKEGDVFYHNDAPEVLFVAVSQIYDEVFIFNKGEKRFVSVFSGENYSNITIVGNAWQAKFRHLLN